VTWGFNSWGEAFFIMNLFHALQYFGLVWWSENKNIRRLFRLEGVGIGKPLTWIIVVASTIVYGAFVQLVNGVTWFLALTLVVSIMHFWYDGFIWSVRKDHVKAG
jgi:hypothetical protein